MSMVKLLDQFVKGLELLPLGCVRASVMVSVSARNWRSLIECVTFTGGARFPWRRDRRVGPGGGDRVGELRSLAAPFVASGPGGVAVRTRLKQLTPGDEKVPTGKLRARLASMADQTGIVVIAVDPAYTSRWGAQHWQKPLTTKNRKTARHDAAAVAIGRRAGTPGPATDGTAPCSPE